MKKILILPNPFKAIALELTRQLKLLLAENQLEMVLDQTIAAQMNCPESGQSEQQIWEGLDLVMVLGGDGSMLTRQGGFIRGKFRLSE